MKIIDNRYKIDENIYNDFFVDAYRVEDLWKSNNVKLMKIYHYNLQSELIDYFVDNQINISNIRHKNLLHSEEFAMVETIDTKNTNMIMYYSISEYIDYISLKDKLKSLNFNEKLNILLDIILVLDFLHFRGYTYKFLNPTQIFILDGNITKLENLSTIIEKTFINEYSEFERKYLSPDFIANNKNADKTLDYYSLAQMLKFLFLQEDSFNNDKFTSLYRSSINEFLGQISLDLEKESLKLQKVNLIELADKIIEYFKLDYKYDLIEERDELFLENKIVGRDREVSKVMKLDDSIAKDLNLSNAIIIEGNYGIGKSRFLREISHRLKLRNRSIYSIKINKKPESNIIDITGLLRQSMKNTSNELKEKYRSEFSSILPEFRLTSERAKTLDVNNKSEKYRIYNRIGNYFKDLSESRTIYLLIDDIQNTSDDFLNLMDYLIKNLRSSNVIFIFAYDEYEDQLDVNIRNKINSWIEDLNALDIKLFKLDLDEIGEIIKNILGIAYVPVELSSILFRESAGNPKKIEDLVQYLYNIGQLFMGKVGRWHLNIDSYSDMYIPSNLDDTMVEKLNIIQGKYYEIVKTMSVFEDLLHKNILIKMLGIEGESLETLLEELIRMKIIEEKLIDWGYSYNINSSELKKMVYFEIPKKEKIALHSKASQTIASFDGDLYDSLFEELLYQLFKSNQREKALEIILNKFDILENKYGSQAIYLLEKAYHMVEKDFNNEIKLEILEKIIDLTMFKGELEAENPYLREYIKLAELLDLKYHVLNYRKFLAELYYQRARIDLCEEKLREIEKINKDEELPKFKIYLFSTYSLIDVKDGELEKARVKLGAAKKIAKKFNLNSELGNIYNRLGIIEDLNGNKSLALEFYERSYAAFIEDGNIIESVKPINNLGSIYSNHLNNEEKAIEYFQKGMEIAEKYRFKKVQITFSINISEIYFNNYEYEKALELILEANKMAMELQNVNDIVICQGILGKIYLETIEYDKAFEAYTYLKSIFKDNDIDDIEILMCYYDFLGDFYLYMGQWDHAFKYEKKSMELASKFNKRQYYKSKLKLILIDFLKNKKFNKEEIDIFLDEYKSTIYIKDFREALYILIMLTISMGDRLDAVKLLEIDGGLKGQADIELLNKVRSLALGFLIPDQDNIGDLVEMEKSIRNLKFPFKNTVNLLMANLFKLNKKSKEAIKYYIEVLGHIYKDVVKIPEWNFKMSFIKSRNTDHIKKSIASIIKEIYGKELNVLTIDKIIHTEDFMMLKEYFDLSDVIDGVGKDEFSQITQIHSYGKALNVENIKSLLSMFKDDYKYNLDLILNYIAKESFATRAFILECIKDTDEIKLVASLDQDEKINIDENVLRLSNRTEKGLLITSNLNNNIKENYKNCLREDLIGIICVPIYINEILPKSNIERRKHLNHRDNIVGYIYLETDRAFNKFTEESLDLISDILYLMYINLENNSLRLIATSDKLTETFTRKYYEQLFQEFIENKNSINNGFSLLMLDLDKFKDVNDTYGHRKGDQVLKEIGKTIKSSVRSTDIVARYGGEEFVVILKDTGENEALMIGEKIRKNVESLKIKGLRSPVSISIGVSIYPNHSKFKEELVEKADQALYYAKENGRNKVCLWNHKMYNSFERVDKLAGLLTGTSEVDNKNILGLIQIINLIEEDMDLKDKIYKYLGELLNVIDSETASIIVFDESGKEYYTRVKFDEDFVTTPALNQAIIDRVVENKKGEFLIDWEGTDDVDPISGIPNWKSLIVLPMIKNGQVRGLTYLAIGLKQNEFDFNSFNLASNYASIFTSLL